MKLNYNPRILRLNYMLIINPFFQSYGEFTASQPWELIVTTLTLLMLALIWAGDLGNHVLDTEKALRSTSETGAATGQSGCSLESKEALSPYLNRGEYNGDVVTQMEKVRIFSFFLKS